MEKSSAVGVELSSKGCENKDPRGCLNAAFAYLKGDGVTKSPARGAEWLEKGCALDAPDACAELGKMLIDGADGVAKSDKRGRELLTAACSKKPMRACGKLTGSARTPESSSDRRR